MFGKEKEQIRQWAHLGVLLDDLRLLEALDFMRSAFGTSSVDWVAVREQVACGRKLSDVPGSQAPAVQEALRAGEKDGKLPEHLAALREEVPVSLSEAGDDTAAQVLNLVILEGVKQRIARMALRGDGRWEHFGDGGWKTVQTVPGGVARRLWAMAGQPYWAPKPGFFVTRFAGRGEVEIRIRPEADGSILIDLQPT